jgi:SOS-response transcriptional repressor LexA
MLHDRFKSVRESIFKGSQEEFAKALNWSLSRVKDLERGKVKELKGAEAAEIEEKFLVNGWWLLTGKGSMSLNVPAPQNNSSFAVPMIDAYAGCGSATGFSNMLINSKDNLLIDPRIFPSDFLKPHLAAIRIAGDSMEPTLRGGDIAFIQTKNGNNIVEVGDIYLISYDGGVYIKRLHFQGRKVKIISDNQLYDPFWYEDGDTQVEFDIIGKVVAVLRFGTPLLFK